jgi:hypothetical protein
MVFPNATQPFYGLPDGSYVACSRYFTLPVGLRAILRLPSVCCCLVVVALSPGSASMWPCWQLCYDSCGRQSPATCYCDDWPTPSPIGSLATAIYNAHDPSPLAGVVVDWWLWLSVASHGLLYLCRAGSCPQELPPKYLNSTPCLFCWPEPPPVGCLLLFQMD